MTITKRLAVVAAGAIAAMGMAAPAATAVSFGDDGLFFEQVDFARAGDGAVAFSGTTVRIGF
ncbi:hypothetical protein [Allostreptomyces psammosilenae]|uniref:Thiamine pyrophosphate-dependent acetolactate synthase large subunit-like protein n=1 Tax=Allostreptomyces psammosilenae TaxID=1892865 RepID=A0A852ZYZ3_9ACTN|nr:hypothetical protein [Allostreptomyces psammosilenae]NYI07603.1 thiamine pyrophosphate-dependent acetolactate synthase large subunit-like protein [Allostreptomyces psammosilenae]